MSYRTQLAEVDLGNLLYLDKAPLDLSANKEIDDNELRNIARECTHHFFEQFWALPVEQSDSTPVTVLPKPTFRLPREKRLPAKRDLTRWERFAKLKGIHNKKKSRKIWDPDTNQWKPRWGKDRIDSVHDQWVLEVPENADPYEDQFAKLTKQRTEKRAKNEFQRLRNIARSVKPGQAPPIGVLSESQGSKNELSRALSIASVSDASLGRFTTPLNMRKIVKNTEKKFKPRMKLSQVVGERSKQAGERQKKPGAAASGRKNNKKGKSARGGKKSKKNV